MNEPNAELKQRIASIAARRENRRAIKRRDLAAHINDDGDIALLREKDGDNRVYYEHESCFVILDGVFTAKQLRFLAEHIEKHRDPKVVINY